ncbi:hypothetical protein [Microbacterium sp.]|uniref:hypothetical protein n=1 Tax=Microbacterium sp. TaxID=51671 RepID=UPI0031FECEAE
MPKAVIVQFARCSGVAAANSGNSVSGILTSRPAFALPIAAHPVGEAGEPNCLGQRVSHGSSHSPVHGGHGLTPVERRDLVEELFGEEIPNLGLWVKFVKQCFEPPFEEPPI